MGGSNAQNNAVHRGSDGSHVDPRGFIPITFQHSRTQSKSTNCTGDQGRPTTNAGNIASVASVLNFAGAKEACWL
jgi:hypothetical protein